MNQTMFTKWFEEKLLPNIPARSLIIMDNAAYHNVLSPVSAPTPSCKKEKIRSWLDKNNFPVKEDCLKAELVDILTRVGPQPTYVLDEIANKQGHEVLRTPPYHPELQPIETCWGIVKNEIGRNCDFTMNNLIRGIHLTQVYTIYSIMSHEQNGHAYSWDRLSSQLRRI
jgi:transposase